MPQTDPVLLAGINTIIANQKVIMSNISSLIQTMAALTTAANDLKTTAQATATNVTALKNNAVDPNDLLAIDASARAITQLVTDAVATLKAT